jgi:hypothetical protein
MDMDALQKRKTPRCFAIDYDHIGVYFITICTQDRRCILSQIVGTGVPDCPKIALTKYGEIAEKYIRQIGNHYDHLSIESYVIMPNHIHLLLFVKNGTVTENGQSGTPVTDGQSGTPVPTVRDQRVNSAFSRFLSTFKRFCNKEYGEGAMHAPSPFFVIRYLCRSALPLPAFVRVTIAP